MIEDPPLIAIHARKQRPSPEQVAALGKFPTGFLVDAMYGSGALPHHLSPLSPGVLPAAFAGVALTVNPGPADVLTLMASMSEIQPGDVVVCATGAWEGCACVGDRVMGMARNAGAVGFVTDGLVRDIDGLEAVGLPVWCNGVSPNSPFNSGPGEIGVPVTLGDRCITSADVLVADRDGVVVVPFARIDSVIDKATQISGLEGALDEKVAAGLIVPGAIKELLASSRVKRFD